MVVKMLMTWDILPGREQEYFEFVVREFIPEVQKIGLKPSDAWFTMYGDYPQILAAMLSPNLTTLQQTLASNEWDSLVRRLHDYVEDFSYKIIRARGSFQI
ncbi:MAG: hypothetical protein AB1345_03780 [Chloroflexota bacterium]